MANMSQEFLNEEELASKQQIFFFCIERKSDDQGHEA